MSALLWPSGPTVPAAPPVETNRPNYGRGPVVALVLDEIGPAALHAVVAESQQLTQSGWIYRYIRSLA